MVREIVGHSAIEVTMTIYAHVSLEEKLFRIKDNCAGEATEVRMPVQGAVVHVDRRRCTWMNETRTETGHSARPKPKAIGVLSSPLER